ncbi:MAG: ribonuclease HII [candidate division Zixibacteria bacterium]|nr:ribonuclease HII [candidate division Zixibacteria bacterium]
MGQKIIIKNESSIFGPAGELENRLKEKGCRNIIGVDEAGRGPLAGPVVAAAVYLPESACIEGLDDSKKLTATKREILFDKIVSSDAAYAVGIIDNELIDKINILRASLRAMTEAVHKLHLESDCVLVDGNQTIPNMELPQIAIIGGDGLCPSISAASIIAKVTRDRIMDHYDNLFADFSFAKHKGYPTAAHMKELKLYGPTPIHRKSYKPVAEVLSQMEMSLT